MCCYAECVFIGIFQEHSTNHGLAVNSFAGNAVSVRHKRCLKLHVPTVDRSSGFAKCLRILGISTPTVHVEFHRSPSLPLVFANIHGDVYTTEDTVNVTCDVGLTRKTRTNKCGDVEADVFPFTTCLVTTPNTCVALCASPTVKRDDEGACVATVVGHNLTYVSNTVQTETVTSTYPSHVSL